MASVSCGSSDDPKEGHSLALKIDGTVWSWGFNSEGQMGDNTTTNQNTPGQVVDTADPSGYLTNVAIVAAEDKSMALKNDGTVWTWGRNYAGDLGDGSAGSPCPDRHTPVQVVDTTDPSGKMHNVAQVASGGRPASWR